MIFRLLRTRLFIGAALISLLMTVAYALAASNTVATSNAGDGAGTISGYAFGSVAYNLNSASPQNIDSVTFTISPSMSSGAVYAKLRSASASYFSCSVTGGTSVSCGTGGETAGTVDELRVIAAQ